MKSTVNPPLLRFQMNAPLHPTGNLRPFGPEPVSNPPNRLLHRHFLGYIFLLILNFPNDSIELSQVISL